MKTRGQYLWCGVIAGGLLFTHPFNAAERKLTDDDRTHWAFQKVSRPPVPKVHDPAWVKNPIDAFVLAELEANGIAPSSRADKATLLRRAYLDVIGLPPAPEELSAFVSDNSNKAWERAVDRLLASPHYGERWARHWLDLARYAESEGFKADETRPHAWRYRDYVIRAFNEDKPYDRFVQEQIAGDELFPESHDARIATGFNRHYPDESNARNLMQRRQEILNDITDTAGAVFTGMTYACARCHDHKYDPILQTDYFRLQAFFANTAAKEEILLTESERQRHAARQAQWEEKTKPIRDEINALLTPQRRYLERDYYEKYPEEIRAILDKPENERTPYERQMAWKAAQYLDPNSREYVGNEAMAAGRLKSEEKKRYQELKAQLEQFASFNPGPVPVATGMGDLGPESPQTFLLKGGSYDKPRSEVAPGFLQILDPAPARIIPLRHSSGRRAALARILTHPRNPLTARVMVNRIWQSHFGRGIVATPSDFGLKGEAPTHPQLLDWLADEFVDRGWSLKRMHRLILTSATYQQSSLHRAEVAQLDPDNRLFWKFPRQRLQGEVIRDSALAVSGMLNRKMGGPGIFPELPEGMPPPRGGWNVSEEWSERNRRSVYVFVRRNTRYPMFDAFDMPDAHESCSRRNVTTSPIQALTLINSPLSLEWAQHFASRVITTTGESIDAQVTRAFELAYLRKPSFTELNMARRFFAQHRLLIAEREAAGETLALPPGISTSVEPAHAATLVDFCHALINANEFVYMN